MSTTPKLFKCTSCGNKCDHITTSYEKDDVKYLDPYEGLCRRCFNKRINGETKSNLNFIKALSPEEKAEILAMFN